MHFERVALKQVGPFARFDLDLPATGLTVVEGPNMSGKTTALGAMLLATLGKSQEWARPNREGIAGSIELVLRDGVDVGRRVVRVEPQSDPWLSFSTAGGARAFERLTSLAGDPTFPQLLLGIHRPAADEFAGFRELVGDLPPDVPHRAALLELATEKQPAATVAALAAEICRRHVSVVDMPLLLDAPLGRLDSEARDVARDLLRYLGRASQILIFVNPGDFPGGADVHLPPAARGRRTGLSLSVDLDEIQRGWSDVVDQSRREHVQRRAASLEKEVAAELGALRLQVLQGQATIQEQLKAVRTGLSDVQHSLIDLRAAVEQLGEDLAPDLLAAETVDDPLLVSRICSEIATRAGLAMRRGTEQDALDTHFLELRLALGTAWERLHAVSQRDLAVARHLRVQNFESFAHLAILSLCRVIEFEIHRNVFAPFRDEVHELSEEQAQELLSIEPSARKWRRSHTAFARFLRSETPALTLGEYPWMVRAARLEPDVPLFAAFNLFIDRRYGLASRRIRQLVEDLFFSAEGQSAGVDQRLAELRNRCAHPPSLRGDEAPITSETFDALWRTAFEAPIELVKHVITPLS